MNPNEVNAAATRPEPGPAMGAPAGAPALTLDRWREALPEELRRDPALADYKDVAGLAKSHLHALKMIGRDKVPVPPPDAGREEWLAVTVRLGRPERPEDYEFQAPELPEGMPYDRAMEEWFRRAAYDNGLLPWQARGLFAQWNDLMQGQWERSVREQEEERAMAADLLRREWGSDYERTLALAKKAYSQFGDEETTRMLAESGLGNDPRLVRMFANIAARVGEARLHGPAGSGLESGTGEVEKEIADVLADTQHPYHQQDHPGHKLAVERMQTLFTRVHPGRS